MLAYPEERGRATPILAKIWYLKKLSAASGSLWSIQFSELFLAMLGHHEGCGRAKPILKCLDYSENYYKKTDEYFSIILFAVSRL